MRTEEKVACTKRMMFVTSDNIHELKGPAAHAHLHSHH